MTTRAIESLAVLVRSEIAPPPVPPAVKSVQPLPPLPSCVGSLIGSYTAFVQPVSVDVPRPPCDAPLLIAPPVVEFPTVRPVADSFRVLLPSGFAPQPPR